VKKRILTLYSFVSLRALMMSSKLFCITVDVYVFELLKMFPVAIKPDCFTTKSS